MMHFEEHASQRRRCLVVGSGTGNFKRCTTFSKLYLVVGVLMYVRMEIRFAVSIVVEVSWAEN